MAPLARRFFVVLRQVLSLLPDLTSVMWLRWAFYKLFLREAGRFSVAGGGRIDEPSRVSIGEGASIAVGVLIDASDGGDIRIGEDVLIGPYCVLRAADHVFADPSRPIRAQGHVGGRIVIGRDCWLGSHVVVTRGVEIGEGSVIGAHSVVTRDIPPGSVAMGVPAVVRRARGGPAS